MKTSRADPPLTATPPAPQRRAFCAAGASGVAGAAHAARAVATLTAAGLLGACAEWARPRSLPMQVQADDRACTGQAPVLLVLLPGLNMSLDEMRGEGLVQAVRARGLAVDVLLAGATLAHLVDQSALKRLHDEVIAPYRAAGYRRLWLAGISLGGYVALNYAKAYPAEVEGVVALAPYLGRDALVQAIDSAGGARAWAAQAPALPDRADDDGDAALWRWLAAAPAMSATPATPAAPAHLATPGARAASATPLPQLHLAYGEQDRFVPALRQLAALLPAAQVDTLPGGHTWAPWRALWARWLDRGVLPQRCGSLGSAGLGDGRTGSRS